MLKFKIGNHLFCSFVAYCQRTMDSVVAEASSASKPSGGTEPSVSGATESSGCAMECIPSTESLRDDGSL